MPAGSGGNNTPSANPGSSLSSGVRKRLQYTRSSSSASSGGSRAERGVGGGGMGLSSSLGRGGSRSSSSGSLGGAEEDDVELDEIAMASERRGGMSGGRIAGGDVGLEEGGGLALRELEATAAAGGPGGWVWLLSCRVIVCVFACVWDCEGRYGGGSCTASYRTWMYACIYTGAGNATLAGAGAGGAAAGRKRYYFDNDTVAKQLKLFWNMAVPYFKVRGYKMVAGFGWDVFVWAAPLI